MYASNILAVFGALVAAVAAVPMVAEPEHHHQHHIRDIVWKTVMDEVIVTLAETKTVWIDAGETSPAEATPQGYGGSSSSTPASDVQPAAYTPSSAAASAPAYTPEVTSTSAYVAPAYTPPASSSSVYVAPPAYTPPTTSSSAYVAPTPESTYVAPSPTSYAAPAESSSAPSYGGDSGSSSSDGAITYGVCKSGTSFTGDVTYYEPGLGACGGLNTTTEAIVAISVKIFNSYTTGGDTNHNPLCWKWVTITGTDGTKWKGQIVDSCPGCAESDLDLPQPFFNNVTINGNGRVSGITWTMD